jgi:hypothetical protein
MSYTKEQKSAIKKLKDYLKNAPPEKLAADIEYLKQLSNKNKISTMKNKFYKPIPLKERIQNFFRSLLFWKGRRRGMIHTMDITWDNIRAVFFPKDFYEKYKYLGSVPYNEGSDIFNALYPLVMLMDREAKPWWCPRWFLRFLHLFGNDNSIVRVRNFYLYNIHRRITKGIMFIDYKTKWHDYDLRISVAAPKYIQDLADMVEDDYYKKGRRVELEKLIKDIRPELKTEYMSFCELVALHNKIFDEE